MYLDGPRPKKKTRMISHSSEDGSFFYASIYQLAAELYDRMNSCRTEAFPHLPKTSSKTATIHKIGLWIANKRIRYERADIHNLGSEVGFIEFIQSPTYESHIHFFVLTQTSMWEHLFHLYRVKGKQKAVTVDDKVPVAGIIFREDMRSFIPDMIGILRASSARAVLDAASGRKLYAKFNPNNQTRMVLDWTPSDVSSIFAKVLSEYNTAMEKYTKGTGGGSGSHAMFAVWDEARSEQHKQWKERSVGWIAQYAGQMSMLYLGVVLMWDAEFGYIFHARKDSMPDDCMIDDVHGGCGGDADVYGQGNSFRTPRATLSGGRRQSSVSSLGGNSSRKGIESVVGELQVGRATVQSTQEEILQMMKTATTSVGSSDGGTSSYISKIKDTLGVIEQSNTALCTLKKRKKELLAKGVNKGDKKMNKLVKDIQKKRRLIDTLETTLDAQQETLRKLTKSEMAAAKKDTAKDDDDEADDDDDNSDDDDEGDESESESDSSSK
jgi:hypothetical protein